MNNFEHHIGQLEALGLRLELGMLVGEGSFENPAQIGTRFSEPTVQIDTYLREVFFETSKSHPRLGNTVSFEGPDGTYSVTEILRSL